MYVIDYVTMSLESISDKFIFSKTMIQFDYLVLIEFASGLAQLNSIPFGSLLASLTKKPIMSTGR